MLRLAEAGLKAALLRASAAKADFVRSRKKTEDDFRADVRSPIDGVVDEKDVGPRRIRQAGQQEKPLFQLAGTAQITAVAALPERAALAVERGDPASGHVEALGERHAVAGTINRVGYSIHPITRTVRVEISLPNSDQKMRPGMLCSVTVVIGETVMFSGFRCGDWRNSTMKRIGCDLRSDCGRALCSNTRQIGT